MGAKPIHQFNVDHRLKQLLDPPVRAFLSITTLLGALLLPHFTGWSMLLIPLGSVEDGRMPHHALFLGTLRGDVHFRQVLGVNVSRSKKSPGPPW